MRGTAASAHSRTAAREFRRSRPVLHLERPSNGWLEQHRGDFFLATKTGDRSRAAARDSIHRSLDRLQTDHLDLIQLHALISPEEWEVAMGPGGALQAAITWRFYYFLPNGYTWLGSKDAGLESLTCTRPTVDKYGDPMCTTYAADNGQIRIGLRTPTRLRQTGQDLRIGDYTFARVPAANNLRLNGRYEYFSAGSAAAVSSSLTFFRDGRFEASNFTGVLVDNDPTNSGQTGGARVTVSGSGAGNARGTYRINGYTLELSYSDGRQAKAFFALVAGTAVIRIGSRTYTSH